MLYTPCMPITYLKPPLPAPPFLGYHDPHYVPSFDLLDQSGEVVRTVRGEGTARMLVNAGDAAWYDHSARTEVAEVAAVFAEHLPEEYAVNRTRTSGDVVEHYVVDPHDVASEEPDASSMESDIEAREAFDAQVERRIAELEAMKVGELRKLGSTYGVPNAWGTRKAELVEAILAVDYPSTREQ